MLPQKIECLKFENEYYEMGDIITITQCGGYNDYTGRIVGFDRAENNYPDKKDILILDISKQYNSQNVRIYFSNIRRIRKEDI